MEATTKEEEFVCELIEDLKACIIHAETVKAILTNQPTNSVLIYEQTGKIDGLKLAILQVIQIAKENQIKTKYDGQKNGTML